MVRCLHRRKTSFILKNTVYGEQNQHEMQVYPQNPAQPCLYNHVILGYPTFSVGDVDYKGRIAHQQDKSKKNGELCKHKGCSRFYSTG